jgi:hypothetical protein
LFIEVFKNDLPFPDLKNLSLFIASDLFLKTS